MCYGVKAKLLILNVKEIQKKQKRDKLLKGQVRIRSLRLSKDKIDFKEYNSLPVIAAVRSLKKRQ